MILCFSRTKLISRTSVACYIYCSKQLRDILYIWFNIDYEYFCYLLILVSMLKNWILTYYISSTGVHLCLKNDFLLFWRIKKYHVKP